MEENWICLESIRQRQDLSVFLRPFLCALLDNGCTKIPCSSAQEDVWMCVVEHARTWMDPEDWRAAWDWLQADLCGQLPYV